METIVKIAETWIFSDKVCRSSGLLEESGAVASEASLKALLVCGVQSSTLAKALSNTEMGRAQAHDLAQKLED